MEIITKNTHRQHRQDTIYGKQIGVLANLKAANRAGSDCEASTHYDTTTLTQNRYRPVWSGWASVLSKTWIDDLDVIECDPQVGLRWM